MRELLKIGAFVVVLLIGVFLGVYSAEKNMQKMAGIEGATRTIQITPQGDKVEISVLGQDIKAENPVENVEPVKEVVEMQGSKLAVIGNQIGNHLRTGARKAIEFMVGWMGQSDTKEDVEIKIEQG
ncbi:DUF3679 domain-containing protein [Hazenella sp. IB182357]|uniref:DUF3679 domain-containing protein n=1 Tax=Polycladospora coralii TaxID=2771432 RepID=A0A926N737_9BACL|nr:DUF3679 domain-containing protein [Polycladospora coralii]MBD1371136.1 DUF3679 domain-containing protein [Polycladospora coralii]MBS7530078.1 DUF3679 domain-containing protein [Polycladospora coralii]